MIKFETLGTKIAAKTNPVIKLDADVANYTFKEIDGILYLIMTDLNGDDAYIDDTVLKANTYLNGVIVKSLEGLKLVVDGKHIVDGVAELAKNAYLTANENGKLAVAESQPDSGVYFVVTDVNVRLTEPAVKVRVMVADGEGATGATTLSGLTDVDTTGVTSGQVLKYDGTSWKPANDATE